MEEEQAEIKGGGELTIFFIFSTVDLLDLPDFGVGPGSFQCKKLKTFY